MARFLVLLLIALLPLRGWTAERMVYTMSAPGVVHTQDSVQSDDVAMPSDCAGMHGDAGDHTAASGHDAHASSSGHEGCNFCQLCMPLAALDAVQAVAVHHVPHARPLSIHRTFDSAESARSVKPPIS